VATKSDKNEFLFSFGTMLCDHCVLPSQPNFMS